MSALMMAFVTVKPGADTGWAADYQANVPSTVTRYGGEYVGVSRAAPTAVECLEGEATPPDGIFIARFGSIDAIRRFLASPDYAPFRQARIAGTDSHVLAFENEADAPHFKI